MNYSENPYENRTLIVLVNYKRPADTVECVKSLLNQTSRNWDCVIYENGSGDNSYSQIIDGLSLLHEEFEISLRHKSFDHINFTQLSTNNSLQIKLTIIEGSDNLGFAGGNNAAVKFIKACCVEERYKYFWFLNNDTTVAQDCLTEFVRFYENEENSKVGICGGTILYQDNPDTIQCLGGATYSKCLGLIQEVENGNKFTSDILNKNISLDYISGASMFTTKEFLNYVGLMEESYFLYYEELDWATRATQNGFSLGYANKALIWHKEGSVLGSGKAISRSSLAEFYGLRSRLKFTRKFYPYYLPIIWLIGALQLISKLVKGKPKNAYSLFNALLFKKNL